MSSRSQNQILRSLMICLLTTASSVTAFAQSCAMCYTTAAAAKANAIHALKNGILVLLVPSLVVLLGIGTVTFRSRDRFNDGSEVDGDE